MKKEGLIIAVCIALSPIILGIIGTFYSFYLAFDALNTVAENMKEQAMGAGFSISLATSLGGFSASTILFAYALIFISIKVLPKNFNLLNEDSHEKMFNGIQSVKRTFFTTLAGIPILGLISKALYDATLYYHVMANISFDQRNAIMEQAVNGFIFTSVTIVILTIVSVITILYTTKKKKIRVIPPPYK